MLVEKISYHTQTTDTRGSFTNIVDQGDWKEVNLVESKVGSMRGNHYHKQTTEYIYLLSGGAEVSLSNINTPHKVSKILMYPGEAIIIPPLTNHTFLFTEDSVHIALLSQVFSKSDPDLHILES